jgi:hypothetical protein
MIVWILIGLAGSGLYAEDISIRFSWAFVHQGKDEIVKAIDYDRNIVRLESGYKIKIYFKAFNACYFYVYLHDSQRDLFLLFPESLNTSRNHLQINKRHSLPKNNNWFFLDENSGIEVFYLIVSADRLRNLEEITARFLNTAKRARINDSILTKKHRVLDEIRRIIKESSYLAGAVEKPIAFAGDFRGIGEDDEFFGKSIEAENVYVKTIRLEH